MRLTRPQLIAGTLVLLAAGIGTTVALTTRTAPTTPPTAAASPAPAAPSGSTTPTTPTTNPKVDINPTQRATDGEFIELESGDVQTKVTLADASLAGGITGFKHEAWIESGQGLGFI